MKCSSIKMIRNCFELLGSNSSLHRRSKCVVDGRHIFPTCCTFPLVLPVLAGLGGMWPTGYFQMFVQGRSKSAKVLKIFCCVRIKHMQ